MPDAGLLDQFLTVVFAPYFWIAGGFAIALVMSLFVIAKFKQLVIT